MNGEIIIGIGTTLIALIGSVITYIVVPYIKNKTTESQREDILLWVKLAVNAVEQMDKSGMIDVPKKAYVLEYTIRLLKNKGINITQEELDILIEAAVYEMNQWK